MNIFSDQSPVVNKGSKVTSMKFKVIAMSCVCLLASSNCFANILDNKTNDEITHILSKGNLIEIEHIFDNGMDINHKIIGVGTPLIIAMKNNNKPLVEYLLDRGADVNGECIQDGNPLITAALTNNLEMVNYLYQQGAQLDAIVVHDETALISASRAGHFNVVKFLVDQGADINLSVVAETVRGKELRSPLNGAKTAKIREFLIANGAVN
jgi:ankyrin repeat protein